MPSFIETDLLFGVMSHTGDGSHWFLCDIDDGALEDIISRTKRILIDGHGFGKCYIVKSGKGFHVLNFTDKLSLKTYIILLNDMRSCINYRKWVKKVGYGVLRISRRSSHGNVPELVGVVESPNDKEESYMAGIYFGLIGAEKNFKSVKRVSVLHNVKQNGHCNENPE